MIDVDECLWALLGTAWHKFLADYSGDKHISEERLMMEIDGQVISGQPDIHNDYELNDYKVTSSWSVVYGKKSWHEQLNVYNLLLHVNGYEIRKAYIDAFLRDWTENNAKRYAPDYPKCKQITIPIALWPLEETKQFVRMRLADHNKGLRPCTDEERWRRKTQWAVMKKGRKTASRVLDTEEEAKQWIAKQKVTKDLGIVERKGECLRCSTYCPVREVCPYREGNDAIL